MADYIDKVWVLTGMTESGDTIGPYVWTGGQQPLPSEIEFVFKRDWAEDFEAGTIGMDYCDLKECPIQDA